MLRRDRLRQTATYWGHLSEVNTPMRVFALTGCVMLRQFLALIILLPPLAWARQTPKLPPAAPPSPSNGLNPSAKPASRILEENRTSIAVIVAAADASLRLGTGFFVASTGLLLTNLHVIKGMGLAAVKTPASDELLWTNSAAGVDAANDLVLLKVRTSSLTTPVALGDSDQARVGEPIVVVGNPEGLEQTVSNGLLSGIREVDGRRLFQISAPISEGSSGSPVFNSRGEVIAVVVSSLESGQNLNFAVPINYAKPLLSQGLRVALSSLPKADQSDSKSTASEAAPDPVKLAVQAMSKVADEVRACEGVDEVTPTRERKPHYSHFHSDAPTDVRFDVKETDSLVAPYEGIIEFSIHSGASLYLRTEDEAASAPDNPMFSFTTRHRYFYRIDGSRVQLDYRTYFDAQRQDWVLQQGNSDTCWDGVRSQ